MGKQSTGGDYHKNTRKKNEAEKPPIIGTYEHRIDRVKSILIDTHGLSESDIETVVRVLQHYFIYHELNAKKILEMIMRG